MAIQEKEYIHLKEYWDFQRKLEYNKEQVYKMADNFSGRMYSEFGPVNIDKVLILDINGKIKKNKYLKMEFS